MKHHIIYVPGLGDKRSFYQDKGIKIWKLFGVSTSYVPLGWHNKQGLPEKLKQLDDAVKAEVAKKKTVSLVGVSAGASAVLDYYADHPEIHKVILICGKVHNPNNVHPKRYELNPDFKDSLERVATSLKTLQSRDDLKNILSIYSKGDDVVNYKDSIIDGAKQHQVFAWSHVTVILFGILFQGARIARFVRSNG